VRVCEADAVVANEADAVHEWRIEVVRAAQGASVVSGGAIESALRAEGLTPSAWGNGADVSYDPHVHGYHKVLYCVSGSIVFHTSRGDVALAPGDRLELPAGVEHSATVGHDGVECVEAFRS
jgi:mannose-6-phosphate isomerase-like protein (cupin superfamily)